MSDTVDYGLRQDPLVLVEHKEQEGARLITLLNKHLLVPVFTAPSLGWTGSSHIVAQILVDFGAEWTIETPIEPPNFTFVAAVSWEDLDGVWQRRKLWSGVGEVLSYPVYSGELLPAAGVHLEIWSVENFTEAILEEEWQLAIGELEIPSTFDDTESTGTELATLCLTFPNEEVPATLEDALNICNYA